MAIPNLKLQAAVYGAEMVHFIIEESDYKKLNQLCWSDSTLVLYWLRTPQIRHKIFVANRKAKILNICDRHDWNYVPTKKSGEWRHSRLNRWTYDNSVALVAGTTGFFWKDQSHWPQQNLLQLNQTTVQMMVANNSTVQVYHPLKLLRFSNWNRLIRSVAFCYLAVDKLKKQSSELKFSPHAKA